MALKAGDLASFIHRDYGEVVSGQIVRLVYARQVTLAILIDAEGRRYKLGVDQLTPQGEALIDATGDEVTPLDDPTQASALREATDELLQLPAMEAEIDLISIQAVSEEVVERALGEQQTTSRILPEDDPFWSWNIPTRMVESGKYAKVGLELAPELVYYLTCSHNRRKRYERTLKLLKRHSQKQLETYVRSVFGKETPTQLAREWGVSRPAVSQMRKRAMEFVNRYMGWSVPGAVIDELAHLDPNWGLREALGFKRPGDA